MKNRIGLFAVLMILTLIFTDVVFAAKRSDKWVRVTFSPVYLLNGIPRVQTEVLFGSRFALGNDFVNIKGEARGLGDAKGRTGEIEMKWNWPYAKFYFSDEDAIYFSAGYLLQDWSMVESTGTSCQVTNSAPVMEFGKSWLWETMTLDFGIALFQAISTANFCDMYIEPVVNKELELKWGFAF
ncbi:MAG: hypothetical protein OEY59_06895 [Deltaproteobacteria bacterium]|nr:hypothetical protein [Deltaproteobacteria bacterium]